MLSRFAYKGPHPASQEGLKGLRKRLEERRDSHLVRQLSRDLDAYEERRVKK